MKNFKKKIWNKQVELFIEYRIHRFFKYFFDISISRILKTKPLKYRQDNRVIILTMLGHDDIKMYLVAIKSFMSNFGYGTIEVINDGTLTESDKQILNAHIPNIRCFESKNVNTLKCPSYISWKRLLRIVELAKDHYVIQLDADTISLSPLIDIHDKVSDNQGFLIGSNLWRQGVDVNWLHDIISNWEYTHVQPSAELIFKDIDFFQDGTKYLKACAGFAGYPKNFSTSAEIEKLSLQIEAKLGKKWHEWGSEQTATLCLISKTNGSSVLPWPQYQNFMFPTTNESSDSASFVHFIGSNRYKKGGYKKLVHSFIGKY